MKTDKGFKSCKYRKAQQDRAVTCSAGQQLLCSRGSYHEDERRWLYLRGAVKYNLLISCHDKEVSARRLGVRQLSAAC